MDYCSLESNVRSGKIVYRQSGRTFLMVFWSARFQFPESDCLFSMIPTLMV